MSDPNLEVILKLKDSLFEKGLSGAEGKLKAFGQQATAVGQKAGVAFLGLSTVIGGTVKAFGDFESQMANVSTLVDTNKESMAAMGQEVLALARRSPVALGDIATSLYDIRSAGIAAENAFGTLESATKLAVAGLGTTSESTNLLTTALNAFSDEGLSASQTADILFKTVKAGKNTVSQLSMAFGATAPIVKSAGVSLADFSAATAALTAQGIPAAQAQNSLRAAIVSLKKPTEDMQKVFEKLGVSSGPELLRVSGSMGEAFARVKQAAEELGVPLEKVTGAVEGSVAITSLATNANKAYVSTLADMTKGANLLDEAFEKKQKTFTASFQRMLNSVQGLAIEIGSALTPTIAKLADLIAGVADAFANLPAPVKQAAANFLLVATAVTGIVAAGGFLIGWISNAVGAIMGLVGALGGWSNIMATIGGWLPAVASGVTGLVGIVMRFIPVVGAIVTAVGALWLAWENNFLGIQDLTKRVIATIQILFGKFWDAFMTRVEAVKLFALQVFNQIASAVGQWASAALSAAAPFFKGFIDGAGNMAEGFLKVVGGIATGVKDIYKRIILIIAAALQKQIELYNKVLVRLGQEPININVSKAAFDGMATLENFGVKVASTIKGAWDEAGKAVSASVEEAKKAAAATNAGLTDPGGGGAGSGGGGKGSGKEAKAAEKAFQKEATAHLDSTIDALTHTLQSNKMAMDETINSMGLYAQEGAKLQAHLQQLRKDEEDLLAAREKLSSMKFHGEAEKKRMEALQGINEQIRQNGIDQAKIENDMARLAIEKGQKIAEAERGLAETKLKINNEFLNKQEEMELARLKNLLDQKKISNQEYYDALASHVQAESEREISFFEMQIQNLQMRKEQLELINGVTAESLALQQQIMELEAQIAQARLDAQAQMQAAEYQFLISPEQAQGVINSLNQILSTFTQNFVTGIIQGNLNVSESFKKLGADILNSLLKNVIDNGTKEFTKWFADIIKGNDGMLKTMTKGMTDWGKAVGKIFGGLFDLVGEVFSGILSFAVSAFKKMFTAAKGANIGAATTKVHEWAINAAAAVAGIPIVGPALAKAAFASAMATGMGAVASMSAVSLAGFASGVADLPADMVAQIHKGEMIVPATFAQSIRRGDLALTGGADTTAGGGQTVIVSFEGAQLVGFTDDLIAELEERIAEKIYLQGGRFELSS